MTVEFEHPSAQASGALIARGSSNSGFVVYLKEGRVHFDYNCFHEHTMVAGSSALTPGRHELRVTIVRGDKSGARVEVAVDGAIVGEGQIATLLRILSSTGMDFGRSLSPVNSDYEAPYEYPGTIFKVVFDLPELSERDAAADAKAQARAAMTRQ
jgi:arylsulfatase